MIKKFHRREETPRHFNTIRRILHLLLAIRTRKNWLASGPLAT